MQHARATDVLGYHAADLAYEVEKRFWHLLVVMLGVLPCCGVYCLWQISKVDGFNFAHVHWVNGLGGYDEMLKGISAGAGVAEERG